MKKKMRGIVRKLQEFGWLWTVKGNDIFDAEWFDITVKVNLATKNRFDQTIFTKGDIWAYGLDQNGVPILRHAPVGWNRQLGSVALCAALACVRSSPSIIAERVEYVALKSHDRKHITVFRPPKGITMWKFLEQYHPHSGKQS